MILKTNFKIYYLFLLGFHQVIGPSTIGNIIISRVANVNLFDWSGSGDRLNR